MLFIGLLFNYISNPSEKRLAAVEKTAYGTKGA